MGVRRGSFKWKGKKPKAKKEDDCNDCDRIFVQQATRTVKETEKDRLKSRWHESNIRSIPSKTCVCYNFVLQDSEIRKWKDELLRASIEVSITTTNNRTRLQLISNGKQVQALYHSRQSEIREEEQKEELRRRERAEEVKISNLKKEIIESYPPSQNPAKYLQPLTPEELSKQDEPEKGNRNSGMNQVYILKLKNFEYYVGGAVKGFPRRVYEHCIGQRSNITERLAFGKENWQDNLLSDIMEATQPIGMKLECYHVLEYWIYKKMRELKFNIKSGGNQKPLFNKTCEVCNGIAEAEGISWKS